MIKSLVKYKCFKMTSKIASADCIRRRCDGCLFHAHGPAVGLKVKKSGGVFGEEGECGDDDVELLVREMKFRYFVNEERSKAICESTG